MEFRTPSDNTDHTANSDEEEDRKLSPEEQEEEEKTAAANERADAAIAAALAQDLVEMTHYELDFGTTTLERAGSDDSVDTVGIRRPPREAPTDGRHRRAYDSEVELYNFFRAAANDRKAVTYEEASAYQKSKGRNSSKVWIKTYAEKHGFNTSPGPGKPGAGRAPLVLFPSRARYTPAPTTGMRAAPSVKALAAEKEREAKALRALEKKMEKLDLRTQAEIDRHATEMEKIQAQMEEKIAKEEAKIREAFAAKFAKEDAKHDKNLDDIDDKKGNSSPNKTNPN